MTVARNLNFTIDVFCIQTLSICSWKTSWHYSGNEIEMKVKVL